MKVAFSTETPNKKAIFLATRLVLAFLFVVAQVEVFATGTDKKLWDRIEASKLPARGQRLLTPQKYLVFRLKYLVFRLNQTALAELLAEMPLEFTKAAREKTVIMEVPMPDGKLARFRIEESPVLAPQVAAELPGVKTFRGQGIDDPTATARFDWTPLKGFHGYVIARSGTVYIDPYQENDHQNYLVYYKHEYGATGGNSRCGVDQNTPLIRANRKSAIAPADFTNGADLRTYRIAIAGSAEYTASRGGQVDALVAVMTAVNRLAGLYRREAAISFTLVSGTNTLFTTPGVPYDNSSDPGQLTVNQTQLDTIIRPENYDVGHLFVTSLGGLAQPSSVCAGDKAEGISGKPTPTGDPFVVDFVAHELGHQFGAEHSYNNSGDGWCTTREPNDAFEPGSGATIMSYCGFCDPRNLQSHSLDLFGVQSLTRIITFRNDPQGGATPGCGTLTTPDNTPPVVDALTNFTIPRNTPFVLTATATDANDPPSQLTYSWEENDLGPASGTATTPDSDADGMARPIFRVMPATSAGATRIFPSLPYILSNANVPPATYTETSATGAVCDSGNCITGEILPSIGRVMNFRVAVRDNNGGAGGAADAGITVTVDGATGPFRVALPNTNVVWQANSAQIVSWDVNGSNANAANVKISLSTDEGRTFPITLVASTPNDGAAQVTIPNMPTTGARIKIEGVNNIFFDISDTNFTIPGPTFHYVAINLGTLGGTASEGYGINNAGEVTGWAHLSGDTVSHAFRYSGGSMRDLGSLGGTSVGLAINDLGEVTGAANIPAELRAFLYSGGSMHDLGTLGGPYSVGRGINNSGQVTGEASLIVDGPAHAFVYSNGSMHDLGIFSNGLGSVGLGMNDSGEVTGAATASGGKHDHAFLYSGGSMRDLGTLGGTSSVARSINNSGQITGGSTVAGDSSVHAFLYAGGSMHDLGTVGGSDAHGASINNAGQVSGWLLDGSEHAILWSEGASYVLDTLVPANSGVLLAGNAINDSGQITGWGSLDGIHDLTTFIATPFYRQVDPPPDVPLTFGNGTDLTRNTGCALCSAANTCRSVIGLKSKAIRIPIMTPKLLDGLLIAANGYSPTNEMNFGSLPVAIAQLANVSFSTQAITASSLNTSLADRIYNRRERVILEFRHTTHDQSTGAENSGAHFVWVIEKEAGDWKIADPGWNNVAPGTSPSVLVSLQAHLNGFETRSGTTGHIISHQFVPKSLRSFGNLDFPGGPNPKDKSIRGVGGLQTTSLAALAIDATGPVDLLLTDPPGRRLGHDQQSGNDFFEIPDGSYFHDEPIMFPDGDGFASGDPNGSKNIFVPFPIAGNYTLKVTGTAAGTSTVSVRLIGPGGAARTTTNVIQTAPGVTSTQNFGCPEVTSAGLALALSASANSVNVGDTVTYSGVVSNSGPTAATGGKFTDILPDNADLVSAQSSAGTCARSGNVVYCSLGDLPNGATATITIAAILRMPGPNTNTAAVVAFENDPNGADNSASVEVNVVGSEPTPTPGVTPPGTPTPTPTIAPSATPSATPSPGRLGNISTRLRVETGDNVLIGGFIVPGTEPKTVILRAIGPSLTNVGVPDALTNPALELHGPDGFVTVINDNWMDAPNRQEIIDTGIAPTNDFEAAILVTLPSNNSAYTVIVRGVNNGTGVGLVEAYDLNTSADSKLANISTRGFVQAGDHVMIGGFIVVGQSATRVIFRAIGPSLSIPGKLVDPTLELRDGNGTLLRSDDNWRTGGQEAEIIQTGIAPSDDLESAIISTLTPGNYTAIMRGVGSGTGIGLIEAYDLGLP